MRVSKNSNVKSPNDDLCGTPMQKENMLPSDGYNKGKKDAEVLTAARLKGAAKVV